MGLWSKIKSFFKKVKEKIVGKKAKSKKKEEEVIEEFVKKSVEPRKVRYTEEVEGLIFDAIKELAETYKHPMLMHGRGIDVSYDIEDNKVNFIASKCTWDSKNRSVTCVEVQGTINLETREVDAEVSYKRKTYRKVYRHTFTL